jgi:hypothetical protein
MRIKIRPLDCRNGHVNPLRTKKNDCKLCVKLQRQKSCAAKREHAFQTLGNKCRDCSNDDRRVLEFDHLGDKIANISELYTRSWDKLKLELKKCELVCANCHKIRTWRRKYGDDTRTY